MWLFLKCLFSLADRNRAVDMIIEFRGVLNLIPRGGIFAEECVCVAMAMTYSPRRTTYWGQAGRGEGDFCLVDGR